MIIVRNVILTVLNVMNVSITGLFGKMITLPLTNARNVKLIVKFAALLTENLALNVWKDTTFPVEFVNQRESTVLNGHQADLALFVHMEKDLLKDGAMIALIQIKDTLTVPLNAHLMTTEEMVMDTLNHLNMVSF